MAGRSHYRDGGGGGGGGGGPPARPFHDSGPRFGRSDRHSIPDDHRDGPYPRLGGPHRPLHSAVIDEQLSAQHREIQILLGDNQRLAATHVALKQELFAAQHELRRAAHVVGVMHADNEAEFRQMYEKSMKLESEHRLAEAMKAELMQVRGDIQKLNGARQELTEKIQVLSQDVTRASSELQRAPLLKSEIDTMKQEVLRVRSAIELEKKGYAENFEQGQVMEKNLATMGREVEKLRAEIANAEKRAQLASTINSAAGYGGEYSNPHLAYGGNTYTVAYPMNRASGIPEATGYSSSSHATWGGVPLPHR